MRHHLRPRTGLGLLAAAVAVSALPVSAAAETDSGIIWDESSLAEIYTSGDGFFSYGPSIVEDGDTTWIWSCHNDEHRVIRDHIYMTKIVDGDLVESRSVLRASPSPAWDSFHTCDPSVISGQFRYDGRQYGYAMFYLGNDLDASAHNQIGVAFAASPEGPWVKYPEPIVTFDRTDQWGVGQQSAVSLAPGSGRVILFYTRGDTSTRAYQRILDFTNMDRPQISEPTLITTDGLFGHDGEPDWLNNYDVAFDRNRQRFYAVREQHPYPIDNPWWIGPSVEVVSIDKASILNGDGSWTSEATIDEDLTGMPRNHNAGLARTWEGFLPDREEIGVVFADSCSSLPTIDDQDWSQATCDSLFEYDLWRIDGTITDPPGRRLGRR